MNKTVKKVLIISICVVLFLLSITTAFFLGFKYCLGLTEIIEEYDSEIVEIGKKSNFGGARAYSISQDDNKITITLYSSYAERVLDKYIFYLKDNIVIDHKCEIHYRSKIAAMFGTDIEIDRKVDGNIVYGKIAYDYMKGKTSSEIIDFYDNFFAVAIKIDELK